MQDSAPNRLKSWFSNYVSSFYTGNEEFDRVIQLKETHTARVSIGMRRPGSALTGFDSCERRHIAGAVALHNAARLPR